MGCDSSIQKLTERKSRSPKVTDRDGRKKPAKLLKSLVDSYQEEDSTGDDIDPDVVELVGTLGEETLKKHKRPANCPELKAHTGEP